MQQTISLLDYTHETPNQHFVHLKKKKIREHFKIRRDNDKLHILPSILYIPDSLIKKIHIININII